MPRFELFRVFLKRRPQSELFTPARGLDRLQVIRQALRAPIQFRHGGYVFYSRVIYDEEDVIGIRLGREISKQVRAAPSENFELIDIEAWAAADVVVDRFRTDPFSVNGLRVNRYT